MQVDTHKGKVVLFFLLFFVFSSAGNLRLELNPNNRVFFSPESSRFKELVSLEKEFVMGTSLVMVVHSKMPLGTSPSFTEAIKSLTERAWRLDEVVSVSSLENMAISSADEDSVFIQSALHSDCFNGVVCDEAELRSLLDRPHIANRYISKDWKSSAIFVELNIPEHDSHAIIRSAERAREVSSEVEESLGVEVSLTGALPMMDAFVHASSTDLSKLLPIVFLLMLGFLVLILRSIPIIALAFGSALLVSVSTTGLYGLSGYSLNTATSALPIIVATLYLATSLHFYMPLLRAGPVAGSQRVRDRVRTVVESSWRPILLANATTAIGLFSMLYVESPPLQQLGVFCGIGVIVGTFVILIFNPAMLFLVKRIEVSKTSEGIYQIGNKVARAFDQKRFPTLLVLVPFIFLTFGVSQVRIDEDFVNYFSEESEFRAQTEEIADKLFGPYRLDVSIDAGADQSVFDSKRYVALERFVGKLRSMPEVLNVVSVADVLEDAGRAFGVVQSISDLSSDSRSQLFTSYELALGYGQSAEKLVSPEHRLARISVMAGRLSMSSIRSLQADIEREARLAFGESANFSVTGEGVPTAWLAKEAISDGIISLFISFVMCGICVWFAFRSFRIAAMASFTAAVPIVCGFGFWGWMGQPLGIAAVLVVAMTIGVVIDDAIHLIYRFTAARDSADSSNTGSVAYSLHRTAPAMIATTIVLSGGYGVLIFSGFEMNVIFGCLASIIVILATLYNLLVTPQLLRVAASKESVSSEAASSHIAKSQ